MALGKFDAREAEPRIYEMWDKAGCFAAGANAKSEASSYCIMIPPPNVTGALHMGHAFNNTLQDILIRWKRMQGFDTLWQPGTDHAGIATQMVTEREMAANQEPSRTEMGRDAFEKRVWQQKVKSRGNIRGQLERLGASCDWSREAFTMSGAPNAPEGEEGNFHDAVIKVFVDLYEKGYIYRGKRLVNWDPHFETAISDLEVENIEVAGHMWHFKYPLADGVTYEYVERDAEGEELFRETRDYISIATTRPETMLGDGAVAVHPDDERYAPIIGKLCEIPVGPKEHRRLIPIITDSYPDPDFGSGAVKITGAHDFNDYEVAKRGGIPMYRLMNTKGAMRADGEPYAKAAAVAMDVAQGDRTLSETEADLVNLVPDDLRGLDRFEAREKVVEQITSEGLAVMTEATDPRLGKAAVTAPVEPSEGGEMRTDADALVPLVEAKPIMQPFGDRSKVVIEPMLTDQWFVDTAQIVGPALDAVKDGTVKILPESGEKTYYHWLENIEPWCISRQLWWGHQIPVWYGPSVVHEDGADDKASDTWDITNPVHFCGATKREALEKAVRYYQNSGAFGYLLPDEAENAADSISVPFDAHGQPIKLWRDPDVLDTWFSSGLWPIGTLGWPEETEALAKYHPTSVLVTGQDILFFWVARMMMMQLAVVNEIPFHTVYLHGLVRDAKGKKMSKSLGNVVDPLEVIDEFGADALRFSSAAMAALGGVLKLDLERIKGYRNFGTKLWNAASYGDKHGCFDVAHSDTAPDTKLALNRWIKGEVAKTREAVDAALQDFRFNDAAGALYSFVWGVFCDWYLEFTKPVLEGEDDAAIAETRATYAWALDQCLILLHPIMPFITEELWGKKDRPKHLIHADWPTYTAEDMVDADADAELGWVVRIISETRSARAQMHVPAGAYVPMVVSGLTDRARAAFDNNAALIKSLARIEDLSEVDTFPKGTVTLAVPGGQFGLPLEGVIDVNEEIARLEKSLGKLGKEIGGLDGRLKNPKFVESAPEDVVEETRANLAARQDEEAKLRDALARLSELG